MYRHKNSHDHNKENNEYFVLGPNSVQFKEEKNINSKDFKKLRNWLVNLGLEPPEDVKAFEIGFYIIEVISKCYKVGIPNSFPSSSIEYSRKNLMIGFTELLKIDSNTSLKYSNKIKNIIEDRLTFYLFLTIYDLHICIECP